jgi:toxin ParE1/3/4
MMAHYRLREKAIQDIQNIWQHSLKTWGRVQAKKYTEDLRKILSLIGDNPHLGRQVDDYPPFLVMPHGSHLIFYIIADNGIPEIVRIPDSRQDRSTISPTLYDLPSR